ncbi:MAG: type 1 glutamine amidotransferase [Gammaproteobacteria bacterium]|nr:type 1 glutamine amidotransferase [Gammaproteobacteria bacterium]
MRIHTLQHIAFEGLAHIGNWLEQTTHQVSTTHFYQDSHLPQQNEFDALIIMGGPMGIYDDQQYPWLKRERKFIKQAIVDKKPVLGICLGSQFIADALGAKVYANAQKEIGWFDLKKTDSTSIFDKHLPERFTALHWHGDTFDLPRGAIQLLSSEACQNQAFSFNDHVLALQFHLEMTPSSVNNIVTACAHELVTGQFIQDATTITSTQEHYSASQSLMEKLLAQLTHHLQ